MTEEDWLDATGPKAIASAVVEQPMRKQRLWAIACVRRLVTHWNGFGNFYSEVLDVGERYADESSERAAVVAARRRVAAERREIES